MREDRGTDELQYQFFPPSSYFFGKEPPMTYMEAVFRRSSHPYTTSAARALELAEAVGAVDGQADDAVANVALEFTIKLKGTESSLIKLIVNPPEPCVFKGTPPFPIPPKPPREPQGERRGSLRDRESAEQPADIRRSSRRRSS